MAKKRTKYGGRKKGTKNKATTAAAALEEDKKKLLAANAQLEARRAKGTGNVLSSIFNDPMKFIPLLKIKDKKGKVCNLNPNDEQLEILRSLEDSTKDTIILKPRQIGSTTITSAWLFWKWYTSKAPITIVILSHKLSSSKHIYNMYRSFYRSLPKQLQRPFEINTAYEMKLEDTGASIMAMSAGAEGGMRSFSANYLHISEYAFAPNPEELKSTALAALNGNKLIIESTANFYNDALHQEILKDQRQEGNWDFLFFPWYAHKEYTMDFPRKTDEVDARDSYRKAIWNGEDGQEFQKTLDFEHDDFWDEDETTYKLQHRLTNSQMYWRRKQIEKFGFIQFKREYPATIDEAYTQGENVYFTAHDLHHVKDKTVENEVFTMLVPPVEGRPYGIGVDVASGVGADDSVICVMDKVTYQPVAILRTNQISPAALAEELAMIATTYNKAKVLVESNGFGGVVINELRHIGYRNVWKNAKSKDWVTNAQNKPMMFEELRQAFRQGVVRICDKVTLAEIRAYFVNERGNIDFPKGLPSHGDGVIAMALGLQCLKAVPLPTREFLPDWIKRQKRNKITDRGAGKSHRRY